MGKWVSIYFRDDEYRKLQQVLEKERNRRGEDIKAWKLLKEWVMKSWLLKLRVRLLVIVRD